MSETELTKNKGVAYEFAAAIAAADIDTIARLHHPEAIWWVLGAGTFDLKTYLSSAAATLTQTTACSVTITGITAEGDRVAFEAEAELTFPDKVYRNQYHNLLIIRDGLIVSGKEYMDTAVVKATFGG